MKINWLWDMRVSEEHARKILKNKNHPEFYIFAEKLFARVKDPELAFQYVDRQTFYRTWASIKKRVLKDAWAKPAVDFWQSVYASAMAGNQRLNLAQAIKAARLKKKLTQRQLADRLGVIQQHISRIESGQENVTFDTLYKFAQALNTRLVVKFA